MFGVDFSGAGAGGYRFNASIVGLAALPLSWLISGLLDAQPAGHGFSALWPRYVLGVPLLWLACRSRSVIAVFFVATPNYRLRGAIARAGFILSGVLFTTIEAPWLDAAACSFPCRRRFTCFT